MDILFEDNHLIVVSKPQNVPSQADSSGDEDMLSMVKEYIKEQKQKPGNVFVGLVHRLDRPTGGVMAFAKTSKCASRLAEQIVDGSFEKIYFAVVIGTPRERQGKLVHYLRKDETTNMVEVVPALTEGAKKAEMEYSVLESKEDFSLVRIKLLTGRSHQIRVQMKAIGNPLFGDVKYGGEKAKKGRLNLFAVELRFMHPITKNQMVFRVYPPENIQAWRLFSLDKYLNVR